MKVQSLQRKVLSILPTIIIFGVYFVLLLSVFFRFELIDFFKFSSWNTTCFSEPLTYDDYSMHYADSLSGRDFFYDTGRIWGYSVDHHAGYPGGVFLAVDNHWALMFQIVFGFIDNPAFIFNLSVFVAFLLIPFLTYRTARNIKLSKNFSLLFTMLCGCFLFTQDFSEVGDLNHYTGMRNFMEFGGYGFLLGTFMSFYLMSLVYKYYGVTKGQSDKVAKCRNNIMQTSPAKPRRSRKTLKVWKLTDLLYVRPRDFVYLCFIASLTLFVHPLTGVICIGLGTSMLLSRTAHELIHWLSGDIRRSIKKLLKHIILPMITVAVITLIINSFWIIPIIRFLDLKTNWDHFLQSDIEYWDFLMNDNEGFYDLVWMTGICLVIYWFVLFAQRLAQSLRLSQSKSNSGLSRYLLRFVIIIIRRSNRSQRPVRSGVLSWLIISSVIFFIMTFYGSDLGLADFQPLRFIIIFTILLSLVIVIIFEKIYLIVKKVLNNFQLSIKNKQSTLLNNQLTNKLINELTNNRFLISNVAQTVLLTILIFIYLPIINDNPPNLVFGWQDTKTGDYVHQNRRNAHEIINFFKEDASNEGRVLVQDSLWHVYFDSHFVATLPHETDKEYLSGPYSFPPTKFEFTQFVDDNLFSRKLNDISDQELKEYFELYNIKYILVFHDNAKEYFGKKSEFKEAFSTEGYLVYEYLEGDDKFCYKCNSEVIAFNNRIEVKNIESGLINKKHPFGYKQDTRNKKTSNYKFQKHSCDDCLILKYHYIDTLRVKGSKAELEPVYIFDDPVPFIKVKNIKEDSLLIIN